MQLRCVQNQTAKKWFKLPSVLTKPLAQLIGLSLLATAQAKDKVKGALLLDVVVRKGAAILELLAGEDESLLIRGDSLLVLDLGLDVRDGVRGLNVEGDRLAGERLHEDLHTSSEAQDKVKGALLLDVVVRKGAAILELLAGKDESLLIRGDT